ncbi:hypothetical protein [Sphaerisporangium sp. TRM90804]|uniref:hypothetical protein n=1 Tax=Sphaerisporangium sp. TRM90804 TaxID=3031113 RepID=UPI00244BB77D|nr:hypothetical protein [Sphaerisporangium sp. TRM90804]MDH2426432.1 hypothetical protein [Sphaerisporangium sp. TRM90804]
MTLHVVQYSGGIGSWATARCVADRHGRDQLVLLFADTRAEDPDLYRFLADSTCQLGVPLTTVADGRTPFGVFADQRFLGNARIAPCTLHLKQIPCRRWLQQHTDPAHAIIYVGIDWNEKHRCAGIERGWAPWPVRFPLCEPPRLTKQQMLDQARALGLEVPVLYRHFDHNNCAGMCVRAGQRHWATLLEVYPDRYARAERLQTGLTPAGRKRQR